MVKRVRNAFRRAQALVFAGVAILLFVSCEDKIVQQNIDQNPVPRLTSLSPSSTVFGGSAFTLTLNGTGFIAGSVAIWNGAERATVFVSSTQLEATILADDIAPASAEHETSSEEAGGTPQAAAPTADDTLQVWVRNPSPGGGTSGALPFVRQELRPAPVLSAIAPTASVIGGPQMTLHLTGLRFHTESRVRWDLGELATTFANASELTAVIPADSLASAKTVSITVFTPPPGGGVSSGKTFSVVPPNPVPTISSLSPPVVSAGGPAFDLTVNGSQFVNGASVLWNGTVRATEYLSDTSVRASITASDILGGGSVPVAVRNPGPGGGDSGLLLMTVENPSPSIATLSPASAAAGTPGMTVTIDGTGLVPNSIARWNGFPRLTTYVSSTRVRINLMPEDLTTASTGNVSVFNPAPGGGISGDLPFTIYVSVSIAAKDLIYDPVSNRLFASVPSTGGTIGNTISAIDPSSGAIVSSVFVGSEPNPLARSDNGQYLYVGLDGSSSVRRYVIATESADIEFAVGTDPTFGPLRAEDIEVLPGLPGTVAISTMRPGVSPRHGGVFIYDNGVRRAQGTQDHTGSDRIELSASPTRLYGYNNETTEFGFRQLTVSASGVTETALQKDLISGFGVDIAYSGGKVFATSGVVINPEAMIQLGTIAATGPMVPDAAIDRVFFLRSSSPKAVVAYDTNTFLQVGAVPLDPISSASKRIVRVGTDGVAFIANTSTVVILQHPVLGP